MRLGFSLLVLASCTPRTQEAPLPPASTATPAASVAAVSSSAAPPRSASWPPPAPPVSTQQGACPMTIVPGKSFGPIAIGQREDTLGASGLPVAKVSEYGGGAIYTVGAYHVSTCAAAVREVWIDDLRQAPDCVQGAAKIARHVRREQLLASYQGCHAAPPRDGGEFQKCENGGVRFGYGMGDFLQVRVGRTGSKLDDECADLLDDGQPVALDQPTLQALVKKTLDLDLLAPYWHPDRPKRDPLRVVKHPAVGTPAFKMFGDPVQWIDKGDADPYFELTRIETTARRVTIEFRYPVEGVTGNVQFAKRGDQWELDQKHVAER